MARQGLSLYEDVLGNKKTLQTLNPRELGLLATNFKDTDVGLGAERWIQSAPMSYWQQHMKPHPTAIWDEGGNLTPLPVTGASLLNPIYNPGGPVAYWLQKQAAPPVQRPAPPVKRPTVPVQRPVPSARTEVTRLAAQNGTAGATTGTPGIDQIVASAGIPKTPAQPMLTLVQLIESLGGTLDQIDALIAAGKIDEAKAAYRQLLEQNPRLNPIGTGIGEMDTLLFPELEEGFVFQAKNVTPTGDTGE